MRTTKTLRTTTRTTTTKTTKTVAQKNSGRPPAPIPARNPEDVDAVAAGQGRLDLDAMAAERDAVDSDEQRALEYNLRVHLQALTAKITAVRPIASPQELERLRTRDQVRRPPRRGRAGCAAACKANWEVLRWACSGPRQLSTEVDAWLPAAQLTNGRPDDLVGLREVQLPPEGICVPVGYITVPCTTDRANAGPVPLGDYALTGCLLWHSLESVAAANVESHHFAFCRVSVGRSYRAPEAQARRDPVPEGFDSFVLEDGGSGTGRIRECGHKHRVTADVQQLSRPADEELSRQFSPRCALLDQGRPLGGSHSGRTNCARSEADGIPLGRTCGCDMTADQAPLQRSIPPQRRAGEGAGTGTRSAANKDTL